MPIPDLTPGTLVEGLIAHGSAEVVSVKRHGSSMTVTFRDVSSGKVDEVVVFDTDGHKIKVVETGRAWEFDGAGGLFRLAAEAHRIRLAYLFDPLLAVHTSSVEPLPHQIAAVYEEMPWAISPSTSVPGVRSGIDNGRSPCGDRREALRPTPAGATQLYAWRPYRHNDGRCCWHESNDSRR